MADRGLSKRSAGDEALGVADNLKLAQASLDEVLEDLSKALPQPESIVRPTVER